MLFLVAVASLAAFNALRVPLHLEQQVIMHPMTAAIHLAGETMTGSIGNGHLNGLGSSLLTEPVLSMRLEQARRSLGRR